MRRVHRFHPTNPDTVAQARPGSLRRALGTAAAIVAVPLILLGCGGHSAKTAAATAYTKAAPAHSRRTATAGGLPSFPGTASPVIGRVTDGPAAISYAELGKPWRFGSIRFKPGENQLTDWVDELAMTRAAGKHVPAAAWSVSLLQMMPRAMTATGPTWAVSHRLANLVEGFRGPSELESTTQKIASQVFVPLMYGSKAKAQDFASRHIEVSGHPAWLLGFKVPYHLKGYDASEDTDVLVMVDTGSAAPGPGALFAMQVPNDADQLLPDITAELRSLRVNNLPSPG